MNELVNKLISFLSLVDKIVNTFLFLRKLRGDILNTIKYKTYIEVIKSGDISLLGGGYFSAYIFKYIQKAFFNELGVSRENVTYLQLLLEYNDYLLRYVNGDISAENQLNHLSAELTELSKVISLGDKSHNAISDIVTLSSNFTGLKMDTELSVGEFISFCKLLKDSQKNQKTNGAN
jgi:hypothetical protein